MLFFSFFFWTFITIHPKNYKLFILFHFNYFYYSYIKTFHFFFQFVFSWRQCFQKTSSTVLAYEDLYFLPSICRNFTISRIRGKTVFFEKNNSAVFLFFQKSLHVKLFSSKTTFVLFYGGQIPPNSFPFILPVA